MRKLALLAVLLAAPAFAQQNSPDDLSDDGVDTMPSYLDITDRAWQCNEEGRTYYTADGVFWVRDESDKSALVAVAHVDYVGIRETGYNEYHLLVEGIGEHSFDIHGECIGI